jgi:hypothetical protein
VALPNPGDLHQVPGQYLLDAMDRLPPCDPGAGSQDLEIDVPFVGRFLVTFQPRRQVVRGLPPRWVWIPVTATRV